MEDVVHYENDERTKRMKEKMKTTQPQVDALLG
jgi:hypothetical protein